MHVNQTLTGASRWLTINKDIDSTYEAKYALYSWLRTMNVNPMLKRDIELLMPDLKTEIANCGITQWRKLTNLL